MTTRTRSQNSNTEGPSRIYEGQKNLHDLSLNLRMKMVGCYVFPVHLYGMEAWTLTEVMLKRLEAFEMWVYRRQLKISWMDRISNNIVLTRMDKDLDVTTTIKRRKLEYFGHMRHPEKSKSCFWF